MANSSTEVPQGAEVAAPGAKPFRVDDEADAADQVGRDLRDSAETIRSLLHDAFQRLHRLDRDSPVTALVAQAVERFQQVHHDIDDLASNLDSPDPDGVPGDRTPRRPPGS